MVLDFTPLTLGHFVAFGSAFLGIFLGLGLSLRKGIFALRTHPVRPEVFYGGALLAGVVGLAGYVVLDDPALKIGLLAAVFLTLVIGIVDEQLTLSAGTQLMWQTIIAVVAVGWGWTIHYVSHPWADGVLSLAWQQIGVVAVPGSLITVLWLVFLMNAVNWLDGTDGLAAGVGVIALLTLAVVSLLPQTQDARTLMLAAVGAGAVLGFLLWNFPPAKLYLGTTGSWFLGLYIGLVAIVGGGKIVTTLLVLAWPVLDVVSVIVQRVAAGQKPWKGDTKNHLHHVLQRAGWRPWSVTVCGMAVSAFLGLAAVTLQTSQKIHALLLVATVMAAVTARLLSRASRVKSTI